jgi:hypothetical protein
VRSNAPPKLAPPGEVGKPPRWRQRGAWAAGLSLFAFETAQSVLLLPLLPQWMPAADVTLWISLTAAWGLVNAAASAYAQPLVRNVARRGEHAKPPNNWQQLRGKADGQGGLLLAAMLCIFSGYLIWQVPHWSMARVAAALLFFTAMGLKLLALNRFIWLNGMGQIGRDKRILLKGSVITLIASLVLAPTAGALWGLAFASLMGALATAAWATQAAHELGHAADGAGIDWPNRQERRGLFGLNLCGYLFMGTDVLLSAHLLPDAQAIAYAFWSRAFACACLLAGMYAQISLPRWARSKVQTLHKELRLVLFSTLLIPSGAALAYALGQSLGVAPALFLLPAWVVMTAAMTVMLSTGIVVCGQFSGARGALGFIVPSALVAASAPVLAMLFAQAWRADGFVFGYAVCAMILLCINAFFAFGNLAHRPAP